MQHICLETQHLNLLKACGHKSVCVQLKLRRGGFTGCEVRSDCRSHADMNKSEVRRINRRLEAGGRFLRGERSWDKGSCCRWGRRSWRDGPPRWRAASVSTDWPRSCSARGSAVRGRWEQRTQVGSQVQTGAIIIFLKVSSTWKSQLSNTNFSNIKNRAAHFMQNSRPVLHGDTLKEAAFSFPPTHRDHASRFEAAATCTKVFLQDKCIRIIGKL